MSFWRKLSISSLLVVMATMSVFVLSRGTRNAIEIPDVEKWQEVVFKKEDTNNDPKDRLQVFLKWYKDPKRTEYRGMVAFYRTADGTAHPFIRSWDMHDDVDHYDLKKVRVALLLDNGQWKVGEVGERLDTHREYDENDWTKQITYRFNGANRKISKTVQISPSIKDQ